MNKIISLIVAATIFSNVSMAADCQFTDLVHNPDGTVIYSKADHVCVGKVVQDNKTKDQQIQDLNKAITLKDLSINTADKRAENWMNTSLKLEETVQKADTLKKDDFLDRFWYRSCNDLRSRNGGGIID